MKVDTNTLYDIFTATKETQSPDLVIGLAHLRVKRPDIGFEEDRALREFLGRHGKQLARAYPDREQFAEVVEACIRKDEEETRRAAEAEM